VPEVENRKIDRKRARQAAERPLYFSSTGRPLYGAFYPAETAGRKDGVLVFCHSLGIEHMVTQRMEVLGARVAASAGFPVFRYDSRGYGDSAGDSEHVTLADLVDDACAAADYARELSGASRIIWVGVRFGCFIAAEAIVRRHDAAALALWEPLRQGDGFFRSALRAMFFCELAEGKRPDATIDDLLKRLETGGALPVVGGYIYHPLYHTARAVELSRSLQHWNGDTLIAQVQHRPMLSATNDLLRVEIQRRGGKVRVALISPEPVWGIPPMQHPQWVSEPLLAATKEWLNELE
jgi:pimeloyl-ACP methyl ester carboxylesterase